MKRVITLLACIIMVIAMVVPSFALTSVPVKSVKLDKTALSLDVGKTYSLKAVLSPSDTTQKLLLYSTSDKNVASVDANGTIIALKAGKAVITVCSSSNNNVKAVCTVTVVAPKPVKIKMYSTTNNYEVPTTDLSELPIMKVLEEKTNTKIDLELLEHSKYDDIIKTKFASGDYPDVYLNWSVAGDVAVQNGLVQDLKSYIDNYAPNLKKNLSKDTWAAVTKSDGSVVAIPSSPGTYTGSGCVIYTRKDWMDKAGVTTLPKTSDDLINMWRRFKYCDFNGNGKADEIPFSAREKFSWYSNLLGMWGLGEQNYVYENGQFIPTIFSSNMKKFLNFMAKAYREGLVDNELITNTKSIWENKITQNRVGSWNHVVSLASDWYAKLRDANGGKDVGLMAIPTPRGIGYDGPVGNPLSPFSSVRMVLKSAKEDTKVAIVKMFDWLSTEEGEKLCKFGIEGDTLTKDASGNYTYDLAKQKSEQTLWFQPAFETVQYQSIVDMIKSKDPKENEANRQAISVAEKEGLPNLIVPMPAPQAKIDNPNLDYAQPIIQEGLANIITGAKPVNYWDEVAANWKKAGGDKLIEETTQWYKGYYNK